MAILDVFVVPPQRRRGLTVVALIGSTGPALYDLLSFRVQGKVT